MKKINIKGFTLMEIIVSVGMIAIIMLFLVRLLVDINYDRLNEAYITDNQFNRAEIIKAIQNDMNDKIITSITNNNGVIEFKAKTSPTSSEITATLTVHKETNNSAANYIKYKFAGTNSEKKWSLKSKNKESHYEPSQIKIEKVFGTGTFEDGDETVLNDTNDCLVIVSIPLLADNTTSAVDDPSTPNIDDNNDNRMDNIILSFYQHSPITVVE